MHNFSLIRKELRGTPKDKTTETNKKLRIALLILYDRLVKGHVIKETERIKKLSEEYFSEYKKLGGAIGYKELSNDFKIVACASLNDMDIVYSEDKRSLCSERSIKTYNIVNLRKDKRTPSFIDFETLRKSKT